MCFIMIKQKHDKDCLQACLSELLEIKYEEIPEFYKLYPDMEKDYPEINDTFEKLYNEFLYEKGYSRILIDVPILNNKITIPCDRY